ncbi:hypothetical protein ABT272_28630 [Streptomyces sp900105245]|uniref:Uncharacterized protein n=1 Tax=Streptomyces sp. 900105245 TaxID=3154379 RepID=A0ABV1UD70_9ACTN
MTSWSDAEELRHALTDAYDTVPSPAPLAAIKQAGRKKRARRRIAVLSTGLGLLAAPLSIAAFHLAAPGPTIMPGAVSNPTPVSGVRVVAPGERVQVKPGFELWLTKDGKHWSTPEVKNSFRSVVDGNQTKGVSVQEEGSMATGAFLSGVFMGKGEASRVVIRTRDGEITGTVVTLAGKPGWGAWYATSSAKPSQKVGIEALMDPYVRSVTVYDASGGIVAQSDIHALTKKKVDIQ